MFFSANAVLLGMSAARNVLPHAVTTDPDKYKVIFENDRVRVIDYRDKPGEKTKLHHHPDAVLYMLSSFKRKLTLENGKSVVVDIKGGEAVWNDEQSHIGENIGSTDTHVLFVELKEPRRQLSTT
jgi:rhodanese-related sulfurtransferase